MKELMAFLSVKYEKINVKNCITKILRLCYKYVKIIDFLEKKDRM